MGQKEQILEQIRLWIQQGLITEQEVLPVFHSVNNPSVGSPASPPAPSTSSPLTRQLNISEILYYIGAAIVFLGICYLVYQNWSTFNSLTRVLVTFGSACLAYVIGLLLARSNKLQGISSAIHLIAALVFPFGISIFFDSIGIHTDENSTSVLTLILVIFYLINFVIWRKEIFNLFTIIFVTWFFFSITQLLLGKTYLVNAWDFTLFRVLIVAVGYLVLGFIYSRTSQKLFTPALYAFGILGLLGSLYTLMGFKPAQNFYELIFPLVSLGAALSSAYFKSRWFLIFGTISLIAYIIRITIEYFSNGLGWPITLIIAGITMIVLGYAAFYFNKKFYPHQTVEG